MFNFKCPYCSASLETDETYIGKCISCFSCSEPVVVPDQFIPSGTEFAGYTIQEVVCANMLWTTYHAIGVTKSFGRNVLLRVPTVFMRNQPGDLYKRFVASVRFSGSIGIDEYPELIESNIEDDVPFFVFDSLPNGIVLNMVNVSATFKTPYECLAMVRKLVVALKKLWENHKFVVQSIRPANICYFDDGHVHILDAGLSQFALTSPDLLEYGLDVWDQSYIAPELIEQGDASEPSADIYSLGKILFYLLTGQDPVNEEDDIRNYNTEVPDSICELYLRMTAHDMSERLSDYKMLLREIDRIKEESGIDLETGASYHETSTMSLSMSSLKAEMASAAQKPSIDLGGSAQDETPEEAEESSDTKKSSGIMSFLNIFLNLFKRK